MPQKKITAEKVLDQFEPNAEYKSYYHESDIYKAMEQYHHQKLQEAGEELPNRDLVSEYADNNSNDFKDSGAIGKMCDSAQNEGIINGSEWMKQQASLIIAKLKEENEIRVAGIIAQFKRDVDKIVALEREIKELREYKDLKEYIDIFRSTRKTSNPTQIF